MQKCEKCHTKFTWKQLWNKRRIHCSQCGTEHIQENYSRIFEGIIVSILFIFITFLTDKLYPLNYGYTFLSLLSSAYAVTLIFPIFKKYRSSYRSNYKKCQQ